MASAPVYAVLLHQPRWYGVPVTIVLWNVTGLLVCLMIAILALPGLVMKLCGAIVAILITVGIHVAFKRSGHTDSDLLEIVVRFLLMPRYLGPR